ncbi:hypothetical protein HELRODRAFT_67233 [Helobdella robusta]|uniref:Dynein heavy chain linker domain-containing protein n=1 Tax=Helobdella robusta TaxID=6412 RepID=T1FYY4_HELRO|nr:hypothetical protein HELRODRAFT_67233 [Helobdella robusta]ESN99370.1 hypothetical protein HELRODRAFT_67233 [Helobdella robusta]
MKNSKYAKAFESDVNRWEKILSVILETVEMLLLIQKLWLYLENIFYGEEIKKQLPKETIYYEDVSNKWKIVLLQLFKIKNVYRACYSQGLYEMLIKMKQRLENIMNSLDMFLEIKRQVFPRFYFISNTDLLEMLGMSKNPLDMQYYIRKCFSNIHTLTMTKVGLSQKWEATHMNSSDGESVMLNSSINLDTAVEFWLLEVERVMKITMKEELKKCKSSLRKHTNKKDKWIKEHPGQCCNLASQIQWTADVTRALIPTKEHADKKSLKVMKKKQVILPL